MKSIYLALLIATIATKSISQTYYDPNFSKPTSGYGADGTNTVSVISFQNPNFLTEDIKIYYPSNITSKVPTIFYSHAFGGNNPANIIGLLNFVAKKGYAIVFVPYQTIGVTIPNRYDNLLKGFRKAARDYPAIIDTTKVGFMGYSFGGGASFANAYKCFTETNWGQNGRFIYTLAQWYSYNITQTELQSFPANTNLLVEIFDDDITNDHRMAIDIFNNISISVANKDFLTLRSDTINSYTYLSDHSVPNTTSAFNALDYYGLYRLLDALCDYTFNGNLTGKNVALGNGSVQQISMPVGLKSILQTDAPTTAYPQSKYIYPCADNENPRASYCSIATGIKNLTMDAGINLYPNPTTGIVNINTSTNAENIKISIYDSFGKIIFSKDNVLRVDMSDFAKGLYFITIKQDEKTSHAKIIKQ